MMEEGLPKIPPELLAIVQRTVLAGTLPALVVVHDDQGDWLVGDGVNDPNVDDASVVAHMSHVVEVDTSVASLASLEVGHLAFRAGAGQAWSVEPHVWPDEDEAERQA